VAPALRRRGEIPDAILLTTHLSPADIRAEITVMLFEKRNQG